MEELREGRTLSRQGNRIAARYREEHRRIDRLVSDAEQRSPEAGERRARIRAATRAGKGAVRSREQATRRLVDALRRLLAEGLSVRKSADRVGVTYHEARTLIRAAEVADAAPEQGVGGQV
jgi:molybdenum-dependent DNA-binding transcriptional regulator ModE